MKRKNKGTWKDTKITTAKAEDYVSESNNNVTLTNVYFQPTGKVLKVTSVWEENELLNCSHLRIQRERERKLTRNS